MGGGQVGTIQGLGGSLTAVSRRLGNGGAGRAGPGAGWCRCRCPWSKRRGQLTWRPRPGSNHFAFDGAWPPSRWALRRRGSRRGLRGAKGRDYGTRGETGRAEADATESCQGRRWALRSTGSGKRRARRRRQLWLPSNRDFRPGSRPRSCGGRASRGRLRAGALPALGSAPPRLRGGCCRALGAPRPGCGAWRPGGWPRGVPAAVFGPTSACSFRGWCWRHYPRLPLVGGSPRLVCPAASPPRVAHGPRWHACGSRAPSSVTCRARPGLPPPAALPPPFFPLTALSLAPRDRRSTERQGRPRRQCWERGGSFVESLGPLYLHLSGLGL